MMRRNWTRAAPALVAALTLAACGGDENAGEAPDAVVVEQPAGGMEGMQDMPGMEGMPGMQMGGGMMDQVQAHMQQMEGAGGEQLRANLPQHRQMVANMIAQFNREMRGMDMAGDEEWSSTVEALREDLRRMPEMSAGELEGFMPEHRERVARLMEMHREMMAGMGM